MGGRSVSWHIAHIESASTPKSSFETLADAGGPADAEDFFLPLPFFFEDNEGEGTALAAVVGAATVVGAVAAVAAVAVAADESALSSLHSALCPSFQAFAWHVREQYTLLRQPVQTLNFVSWAWAPQWPHWLMGSMKSSPPTPASAGDDMVWRLRMRRTKEPRQPPERV